MILFRYLAKEVFISSIVITLLLVLIFLSNQFVRLLTKIAAGKLALSLLIQLLLMEVPVLVGYLLPIGLFFGILLTYGRMYAESEMTVMHACGVGQARLIGMTFVVGLVMMVIVSVLVMWVTPSIIAKQESAMANQGAELLLQTVIPGRFQALKGGQQVFYVANVSADRKQLNDIFIAQYQKADGQHKQPYWAITTAAYAQQVTEASGKHLVVAYHGYRYSGLPGKSDYEVAQFTQAGLMMPEKKTQHDLRVKALPTTTIYHKKNQNLAYEAEWQWRLSMPFSIILLVLLGVPLSRVNPRQGKFAKLLPAILLYIVYANMLFVARGWIESGAVPPFPGMLVVHLPLLLMALVLIFNKQFWWRLFYRYQRVHP